MPAGPLAPDRLYHAAWIDCAIYTVLLRKIFGQIKSGHLSMERWACLATCVMTWRARGKSIMEEVCRIV